MALSHAAILEELMQAQDHLMEQKCATGYGKEGSRDSNLCTERLLGCHESQDVDTDARHHCTVISLARNRTDAGTMLNGGYHSEE